MWYFKVGLLTKLFRRVTHNMQKKYISGKQVSQWGNDVSDNPKVHDISSKLKRIFTYYTWKLVIYMFLYKGCEVMSWQSR